MKTEIKNCARCGGEPYERMRGGVLEIRCSECNMAIQSDLNAYSFRMNVPSTARRVQIVYDMWNRGAAR